MVQFVEPPVLRGGVQALRCQDLVLRQRSTLLWQPAGDDLRHRLAGKCGDVLCQVGHPRTRPDPKAAGIGFGLMQHQPQQRGLALPIASHQADALALVQLQRHLVEQRAGTVGE